MGCVSRFPPAAFCSHQQSFESARGRWGQVWGILIFGLKQRSAAGQGLGSSICSSLAMGRAAVSLRGGSRCACPTPRQGETFVCCTTRPITAPVQHLLLSAMIHS